MEEVKFNSVSEKELDMSRRGETQEAKREQKNRRETGK
jgi:hypothetical protein